MPQKLCRSLFVLRSLHGDPRWTKTFGLLLVWLACCSQGDAQPTPTITVSGHAEIDVPPDQAMISLTIETRQRELPNAKELNDKKYRTVLSVLAKAGVDAKYIDTNLIEIDPIFPRRSKSYGGEFEQQSQEIVDGQLVPGGYKVSRGMNILLTQLSKFEDLYSSLVQGGVNRVHGIEFRTSKQAELKNQVQVSAVKSARAKAEMLASELGAKLAGVQTIRETTPVRFGSANRMAASSMDDLFGGDPFGGEMGSGGANNDFAPGQIRATASVQVVFRLADTEYAHK